MNPSVRSMNIKSADFLQTSLSGNRFTITEPIKTPTKNDKLINTLDTNLRYSVT